MVMQGRSIRFLTVGQQFGRWTVISEDWIVQGKERSALVRCSCPKAIEKYVRISRLLAGESQSCGCLMRERVSKAKKTHGMKGTSEYRAWQNIKNRCYNPKDKKYAIYGGRGIKICERWLESFENFFADMGLKPSLRHSIDRFPNRDGNYEPGNCRWATPEEQSQNRSCVPKITFRGETLSPADWARRFGISRHTVNNRLRIGWSMERIAAAAESLLTDVPTDDRDGSVGKSSSPYP
jgi:hypothetical protein